MGKRFARLAGAACLLAAAWAGCGDSPLALPSPVAPPGADRAIWGAALGILRDAARGVPPYGRDEADPALTTLRIFRDREMLGEIARGADLYRAAGAVAELAELEPGAADPEVALRAARDGDAEVRAQAAGTLGALVVHRKSDVRLVDGLRILAGDPEAPVRRAAFGAMRTLAEPKKPPLPWLLGGLRDPEGSVRAAAAGALSFVLRDPPPAAKSAAPPVSDMLALLEDPHEGARSTVMRLLARTAAGRTRLEPLLDAAALHTRIRAASLLAGVAHTGERARGDLAALLHAPDADIRRAAILAVHGAAGTFEPPAQALVAAALLPLLADPRTSNRVSAARVLLTWNLSDYRDAAMIALRPLAGGDDHDALASAFALAVMDDPRGDAGLLRLALGAPAASNRALAATYLSRLEGDHVLPTLARALHDPAPAVRVAAAGALLRSLKRR